MGSTYVQWFNAADPNAIYPNTTWINTDIDPGNFIRAAGGASNTGAGVVSGTTQTGAIADHTHAGSVTINNAGALTTGIESNDHAHYWGGWWSTDNSADVNNVNGDGGGNTYSDVMGYWASGGSNFGHATSTTGGHSHGGATAGSNPYSGNIYIPYDDNLGDDAADLNMGNSATQCGSGWNGDHTVGNFMGRLNDGCMNHNHNITYDGDHAHTFAMYAHRHWLKQRATTGVTANHTHTVPDHGHTGSVTINSSGGTAPEIRPVNESVIFWRRTN